MASASLRPGQNAVLQGSPVVARVDSSVPADVFVLIVDDRLQVLSDEHLVFYNNPQVAGVSCDGDTVTVDVDRLPAEAASVLVVVAADAQAGARTLGPVTVSVSTPTGAGFLVDRADGEAVPVRLMAEIYRRGTDLKVRANGQGMVAGLPALLAEHGVVVDDDGAGEQGPDGMVPGDLAGVSTAIGEGDIPPDLDPTRVGPRLRVMTESVARAFGTHSTGVEVAGARWADELGALGDLVPAPADIAARRERARRTHDELMASIEARRDHDLAMLSWEHQHLADQWPRSVAPFDAAAWHRSVGPAEPCDVWRYGTLARADVPFTVPLVFPVEPILPFWVLGEEDEALGSALLNLVLRMVAARAGVDTVVHFADPSGHLTDQAAVLAPLSAGPAAPAEVARRLDLRVMAAEAGMDPTDHPIVVVAGASATTEEDADAVLEVVRLAAVAGATLVVVGPIDDPRLSHPLADALTISASAGTSRDPWAGLEWTFTPAVGSAEDPGWSALVGVLATR